MYNTFTFNYTVVSTGAWAQHPVEYVVLNAASIPLVLLFAVVVRDGATAALPGWADPEGQGAAQRAGAPPAGPGRLILLGTLVEHEVGAHGNRRCWLVATGGRSGLRLRQQRDGPDPGAPRPRQAAGPCLFLCPRGHLPTRCASVPLPVDILSPCGSGRQAVRSGRPPPAEGWHPQATAFWTATGLIDTAIALLALYFVAAFFGGRRRALWAGLVSLATYMCTIFVFNYTVVATGAWAQHPVEYVVLNAATIPLVLLFAVVIRNVREAAGAGGQGETSWR